MEGISRIGVVGTGFIAAGLVMALEEHQDLAVSKVLTRTNIGQRTDFPRQDVLTNSVDELIEHSDLIVECSGDAIHATDVVDKVMASSLPVVTMDSELQVMTGSYFVRRGFITEAEGDQPGCLAALRGNVLQMGRDKASGTICPNTHRWRKLAPYQEEIGQHGFSGTLCSRIEVQQPIWGTRRPALCNCYPIKLIKELR